MHFLQPLTFELQSVDWRNLGEGLMAKYKPRIGSEIDIHTVRHRQRIEYITLTIGAAILAVILLIIIFRIPVEPRGETWLSIILALAVAASSHGFAGAMSVTFRHAGLIAQGTLGFGIFIISLAVATVLNCCC